ncbi:MAG TPA: SpoIIE family protein phosphatase [Candidatus Eisenbacteria bacterium]
MFLIQVVEYLLIAGAAAWYWQKRADHGRDIAAHFTQLLLGLTAFLAITAAWVVAASNLGPSRGAPPGVATLVQLLRVAAIGHAFLAAVMLAWPHLAAKKVRWIGAILALWLAGARGGSIGVPAFFWLLIILRKSTWPQEIHGWRRLLGLILVPLAVAALFMIPLTTFDKGVASVNFTPAPDPWPAPLMTGDVPQGVETELALIRPLDTVLSLFRSGLLAQLLLVSIQFLTLPVRLRGVGIKRRLAINYFFIRVIPATLGVLSYVLLMWGAFGLHKAAMVRVALEETIERCGEALDRLAAESFTTAGAPGDNDASARLASPRLSLGDDGPRARFLRHDPEGVTTLGGPGDSLVVFSAADTVQRRRDGGLIAVGGGLWLYARRPIDGDSLRRFEVYVPLDSVYLARVAARRHIDIRLSADPDLFIGPTSVTSGSDTTWTDEPVHVTGLYHEPPATRQLLDRRFVLGQSFLPIGNWLSERQTGMSGAVTLKLNMAPWYVIPNRRDLVILVAGNAWTIGLLLLVIVVVSVTEGMAVRTGRGILNALFDDVSALQVAAQRFGKGDLDYRLPVHGKDEIATVAGAFNEMAASLKAQQAELVEKERLELDLKLARDIQRRLLPQAPPVVSGVDLAGVSIPSLEVGGDLFAFFNEGPTRLGLALGDVSGKSVPAAILMSNTLAALRAEAELAGAVGGSLARLNRTMVEHVETGRFVTLVYALLDPTTGALEFASAGHNPALLARASGEVEWLEASGPPLGVLPGAEYEPTSRKLAPGDVLVLYSDGITEAARLPDGGTVSAALSPEEMEFFDESRLAEVVTRSRHLPAAGIMEAVLAAVHTFSGNQPQADDVTLLVVRYTGTTASDRG